MLTDLSTPAERGLPVNEAAEAAIVTRLLVDPEQVPAVALDPSDFHVRIWRRAFEGMQKLSAARRRIDIVTLQDATGDDHGELGRRVSEAGHFTAPLEEYVAIVKRDAFRRRLIGALEQVTAEAYVEEDREKLVADLHDAVINVTAGIEQDRLISPGTAVDVFTEVMAKQRAGTGELGLTYGLGLDELLNPAAGGDMIVLAARPSVGKTALAETIADHWAQIAPSPVLFVSLEMSIKKLLKRTVSRRSGLHANDLRRGLLNDQQYALALETAEALRAVGVWYLDDGFATTASVRAAAAKVRLMAGGLSGIVIDYLQLLKDAGDGEVQRVTKISRQVKAIAMEFNVPVLTLSQLNRSLESREDKHPRLYDLRESGAIEQDADTVIGLYRELGTGETDVEALKQRDGEVGMLHLWFDQDHVRFEEAHIAPMLPTKDEQARLAAQAATAQLAAQMFPGFAG